MARVGRSKPGTLLTGVEQRVLIGMALGKKKAQVGREQGITEHTVRTHTRNIMARTDTKHLEHALSVANARGDITIHAKQGEPEPRIEGRLLDILVCIARGRTREQIAEDLNVSIHTVKLDMTKLYEQLQAKTRIHLVYRGFETGNLVINRRKKQE